MQFIIGLILLAVLFAKLGIVGGGLFLLLAVAILWVAESRKSAATAQRGIEQGSALLRAVSDHSEELSARRKMLRTHHTYGRVETRRWEQEKAEFVTEVFGSTRNGSPLLISLDSAKRLIDQALDKMGPQAASEPHSNSPRPLARGGPLHSAAPLNWGSRSSVATSARPSMSPAEFEQRCADVLRDEGWVASVTKASGDHGADIVASMAGLMVVVQCMLHSSPVGNAAVQEIHTAKDIYGAEHAVVVTNNAYTRHAKEATAAVGVLLMHDYDLHELEFRLIGGVRSQPNAKPAPWHERIAMRGEGVAPPDAGSPRILDGRARERSLFWGNGKWVETRSESIKEQQPAENFDASVPAEFAHLVAPNVVDNSFRHAEILKALDARARDESSN